MQPAIEALLKNVMQDPLKVTVGIRNATSSIVTQELVYVANDVNKLQYLRDKITTDGFEPPMLIFVQSKVRATELFKELEFYGMNVEVIHGDRKKEERDVII